jgi:hypothetical protein
VAETGVKTSAELLGQSDDDALRATQEAEQVFAQAGNDAVDVVDSEHDAAHAQRSPAPFPGSGGKMWG